ncbi:MAG: hypothetical protein WCT19_02750 [Candidatus Paceibacterota bacterium]
MVKRSNIKSKGKISKLKKKKIKIVAGRAIIVVTCLCAFLFALSYTSQISSINIQGVRVDGNDIVDASSIGLLASSTLSGKYFSLFPKTNTFFYPKSNLAGEILTKFKRVASVAIVRDGFDKLVLNVVERQPFGLWCEQNISEEVSLTPGCYYMDKDGLIFDEVKDISPQNFTKYYGDIKDENPIGKIYLDGGGFKKLMFLENGLSSMSISFDKFLWKDNGDFEMVLKDGQKVYWSDSQDYSKVIQNLDSIKGEINLTDSLGTSAPKVEYVDLRYGNKIYYKLR